MIRFTIKPSLRSLTLAVLLTACRPYSPPAIPTVDETTLPASGGGGACTPASDAAVCLALGVSCGPASGADNCGRQRTIASCGGCGDGSACRDGRCIPCTPETDAGFCERLFAWCGEVSDVDNCDRPRTVASCGACPEGETCDVEKYCRCAPETDEVMCGRLGRRCGRLVGNDNCGDSRSIATCGSCGDGTLCIAGSCCTPETDAELCSARGGLCGAATLRDRCGQVRTLAGCPCDDGLVCDQGRCCTPETDATLCTLNGATCGMLGVTDGCGQARTVPCGQCLEGSECVGNVCL
ncbi:MAG: hypothetical protein RL199_177 [Pseudomonadota bacterium]|jgi:hypothetical protein